MNSMLSDSVIALALSSVLLIIVLSADPVLVLENSFDKFKRVKDLEEEIKDLFRHGCFGELANYLELNSPRLKDYLNEIYERVRSKGITGLRLLVRGKVVYTCGFTDHGWVIRVVIPSSKGIYLLEFFVCGD